MREDRATGRPSLFPVSRLQPVLQQLTTDTDIFRTGFPEIDHKGGPLDAGEPARRLGEGMYHIPALILIKPGAIEEYCRHVPPPVNHKRCSGTISGHYTTTGSTEIVLFHESDVNTFPGRKRLLPEVVQGTDDNFS